MAKRPVTTADVLGGHVTLDLECLDRIYLNGYVPNLQRHSCGPEHEADGCDRTTQGDEQQPMRCRGIGGRRLTLINFAPLDFVRPEIVLSQSTAEPVRSCTHRGDAVGLAAAVLFEYAQLGGRHAEA
jgi:hypothetical protein